MAELSSKTCLLQFSASIFSGKLLFFSHLMIYSWLTGFCNFWCSYAKLALTLPQPSSNCLTNLRLKTRGWLQPEVLLLIFEFRVHFAWVFTPRSHFLCKNLILSSFNCGNLLRISFISSAKSTASGHSLLLACLYSELPAWYIIYSMVMNWHTFFSSKFVFIDYEFILIIKGSDKFKQFNCYWLLLVMCSVTSIIMYFIGLVTLFFADNSLTECRITIEFIHNLF